MLVRKPLPVLFQVGVTSYPTGKVADRPQWVLSNPGQIVLNGSQVHWTAEVEVDLPNGTISRYASFLCQDSGA